MENVLFVCFLQESPPVKGSFVSFCFKCLHVRQEGFIAIVEVLHKFSGV